MPAPLTSPSLRETRSTGRVEEYALGATKSEDVYTRLTGHTSRDEA